VSNSAINSLADPTTPPSAGQQQLLGLGGEVFLLNANAFFHLTPYQSDNSVVPTIQFRSIPVANSYILQQVVAADRRP
jgi:hypothetical protein